LFSALSGEHHLCPGMANTPAVSRPSSACVPGSFGNSGRGRCFAGRILRSVLVAAEKPRGHRSLQASFALVRLVWASRTSAAPGPGCQHVLVIAMPRVMGVVSPATASGQAHGQQAMIDTMGFNMEIALQKSKAGTFGWKLHPANEPYPLFPVMTPLGAIGQPEQQLMLQFAYKFSRDAAIGTTVVFARFSVMLLLQGFA